MMAKTSLFSMNTLKSAVFFAVPVLCAALSFQIISLSRANQDRKNDYAEINNIKYGLFSINQWKSQLSDIINDEIADFDPGENARVLKPMIEQQLSKLIDAVDARIRQKNSRTFKGRMKQAFINTFVDMKDIKDGVPQYADEIFKIMQKPKAKKTLKELVADKVENYFEKTFEQQDLSGIDRILATYGVTDTQVVKDLLDQEISSAEKEIANSSVALIALACFLFLIAGLSRERLPSSRFLSLVLVLFTLLLCGVTTPMIDLEAKISEMSFVLMDHPVRFLNQILYFQTKSVLDVFHLMIAHPDLQMKIVGILMVMFSIVFPVTKLLASVLYYYNHWGARANRVVQYFVLKSGKWSMTDVMIIAIFMAYIGFNGVVSSQFGKLHSAQEEIVLLTTNGTSLQIGFYLFLTYALLALFLSGFLTKKIESERSKAA